MGRERTAGPGRPRARKRFGQHFLHDPAVIGRIIDGLAVGPADHLVEIGPGRGALTRHLLASPAATVDAIEIDRDLAARLREQPPRPGFALHEEDALQMDFAALAQAHGGPLRIIGNLPYNISTPLLFHLIGPATPGVVTDLTVMLQREVALRIAAPPGDEAYGRLTVMLAPYVDAARLMDVGPGAFQPPPAVWSTVLRLTVLSTPRFRVSPSFAQVVSAVFSARRKTLRNALRQLLEPAAIEACGLDPGVRPEKLSPLELNTLAESLDRVRGASPVTPAAVDR